MPTLPPLPRLMQLPSAPAEWTRRRLQILLGVIVVVGLAVVAGAAWSVAALLRGDPPTQPSGTAHHQGPLRATSEDELADAALPQATLQDAQPGPLSTATTGRIVLPSSTGFGPVDVPTGFTHSPEGALAQLIAIDRAALEPASVRRAQHVIGAWAAPGGPTAESWSVVEAVATLLSAGGFPATGAPEMSIVAEPAMGFIKGTVGEDFVIGCVDFVITATTATTTATTAGQTNRVAAADCQRMVWREVRWVIGPGQEPAPAPSLWPGGQASVDAGYQWLEVAP